MAKLSDAFGDTLTLKELWSELARSVTRIDQEHQRITDDQYPESRSMDMIGITNLFREIERHHGGFVRIHEPVYVLIYQFGEYVEDPDAVSNDPEHLKRFVQEEYGLELNWVEGAMGKISASYIKNGVKCVYQILPQHTVEYP